MNLSFNRKSRRWLIGLLVAACSSPVLAIDLLELPAIQTNAASRGLLLDITSRTGESEVAVGAFGVIIVSEDGGANWTQSTVPASVALTAVNFPTENEGWVVGHDGLILHSEDGGKTWQEQLNGNQLNDQIIAVTEAIVEQKSDELEALQNAEEPDEDAISEAEFLLEEAEFALEGAQDDVEAGPVRPLLDVWFRNELEGFVTGSYGMLIVTEDGGENWELVSERMDNPEAFHLNQIVPAPDGALFIAGEAGFIYRSTDNGLSWETLEPGYEGSFYGIVVVPDAAGSYELLAYGLRGNLFSSADHGDSWEQLDSGTTITLTNGTLLKNGTVMLVGQGGTILTRAPGADTFQVSNNPDRRVISGLTETSDGHVLLVGLGGVRKIDASGSSLAGGE